jgi:hypothetical protein
MESNVTSGRFASTTCLVKFVVGDDTPKFSNEILNLYASLGINKPCELAD